MKKLFVIDASGWIYRSYFAIRNMTNAKGESTNALFGFIRTLQKLLKDFHPEHIVAIFDGPHNSKKREAIYADYKAHRSAMPPDLLYQIERARTVCELSGIPFLSIPEVEADDTMGSIAKWAEKENATVYLCTSDKDMAQVVSDQVFLLNTHKDNLILGRAEVEATYGVPPEKIIDLLSLIGDTSDNIPGLPGFGPKTAIALIKEFGSLDYILDHPEVVTGKKQETIIKDKEKALLSRLLVTLDTSVDFPRNADFFRIKPHDVTKLKEFYVSMNFSSLLRELEETGLLEQGNRPEKTVEAVLYNLVDDEAAFQNLLSFLRVQKEICFNTETTALQPIDAELVGIGFGIEPRNAWYVPTNGSLGLKRVLEGLKPIFENKKIGFYGHNI